MADVFKSRLEAILKVQLEERDGTENTAQRQPGKAFVAKKPPPMYFPPIPPMPGGRGGPPVPGGVSIMPGMVGISGAPVNVYATEWTHYIALKIDSLVPLGQLLENIEGVSNC